MASGTKGKNKRISAVKAARADVVGRREIPWGTIIAFVAILGFAGAVFGYYWIESAPARDQASREEAAQEFKPTAENPDPSKKIDGIVIEEYKAAGHIAATDRVAYDQSPPFGGPHDGTWADCDGTVYEKAVRTENMVHALEHGAVWIAYNPDQVDEDGVKTLAARVHNKPYTLMSPYPGLDQPISLQSWDHQLKLDDAGDQRIDEFIVALRKNPFLEKEANATCQSPDFDEQNPPPFDATKPGKDAKPMDFNGGRAEIPTMPGGAPTPGEPGDSTK